MMIEEYSFGRIRIDGEGYTSDVIVYPDRVDASWWRKEGHSLAPEDLRDIIEAGPELVIIGTGAYGVLKVPETTRAFIEQHGIELIAEPTAQAVQSYNELSGSRRVIAGLHLTC